MNRQIFNRQPARAVLIDLQPPMDMSCCVNIHQAMRDVLLMLVHMSGPVRVPLFSLSVLRGGYTECLFPLQPIKGNLPRLQGALSELHSFARELAIGRLHSGIRASLFDGIQQAVLQFKRLLLSMKQDLGGQSSHCPVSSFPSQIEIIILTAAQDTQGIRKSIERAIEHIELENLKKIHVVSLIDSEKLIEEDLLEEKEDEPSLSQGISELDIPDSPSELSLSLLDITTCNSDIISLCNFYKTWFIDCSTDSEHLHILLPSTTVGTLEQDLILKCDMHERMLNPSLFPSFTKNLSLHVATAASQINPGGRGSSVTSVPIYKLKCVQTISCGGVCESVLFGTPIIVTPTYCWKLDWEELENNQLHFQALCHYLREKDQALLLLTDLSSSHTVPPPIGQVLGHYLLMPSPFSSSLLLKSIVSSEFLLPVDNLGRDDDEQQQLPNPDSVDCISESLSKLKHSEIYNPFDIYSNLFHVMSSTNNSRSRSYTSEFQRGGSKSIRGGVTKRKATGPVVTVSNSKRTRGSARNEFIYGGNDK